MKRRPQGRPDRLHRFAEIRGERDHPSWRGKQRLRRDAFEEPGQAGPPFRTQPRAAFYAGLKLVDAHGKTQRLAHIAQGIPRRKHDTAPQVFAAGLPESLLNDLLGGEFVLRKRQGPNQGIPRRTDNEHPPPHPVINVPFGDFPQVQPPGVVTFHLGAQPEKPFEQAPDARNLGDKQDVAELFEIVAREIALGANQVVEHPIRQAQVLVELLRDLGKLERFGQRPPHLRPADFGAPAQGVCDNEPEALVDGYEASHAGTVPGGPEPVTDEHGAREHEQGPTPATSLLPSPPWVCERSRVAEPPAHGSTPVMATSV